MNRLGSGDLAGGNDAIRLQVTIFRGPLADANGVIGKLNVHGINICLGIDGDRFHIEFTAGTNDPQGDFATIGDKNTFEHDRLTEKRFRRRIGAVNDNLTITQGGKARRHTALG